MAKKALCIGINDYPGTHMDLRGCVNDAEDWTETLEDYGYRVSGLLNDQATKAAMKTAMSALISGAEAGDSLVITFSGHGTYQPDMDNDESDELDEALCPYDIQRGGSALTDDEIHEIFNQRKEGVSLVFLSDSCHSGTVTRAAPAEPDVETARPRFMPMGNWLPEEKLPAARGNFFSNLSALFKASAFQGAVIKAQGDLLLSGCEEGANNFSYDAKIKGRFNGAFTHYALKTLQRDMTYTEWHRAIRDYLPSASFPQTPQIVGNAAARNNKVFS